MSKIIQKLKDELTNKVNIAIKNAIQKGQLPESNSVDFQIEVPADPSNGDFSTNVAMNSAKTFKLAPRKIAEIIVENIDLSNTMFNKIDVAGPGFINLFLHDKFYGEILKDINTSGKDYGRSNFGQGKKVMIEFVSANPTGPMHLGNARGGALGDCLGAVMNVAGYNVFKEFYINDAGNQIDKFAISLEARYIQLLEGKDSFPFPEDGYHGEDITHLAQDFINIYGDQYLSQPNEVRRKALIDFALPKNIEKMQRDLNKYRITYDNWFKESTIHENGEVQETINQLTEKGLTYELDGALWYKATAFGSEKDEVLVRQNNTPTYFAADIAYHRNKFLTRNFDLCIDIWGADHHGHVARMKGAMEAIGIDSSRLDVVLMQLVRLVRNGEVVRMSKRTGKAIQLADLLDEVSIDAARFIFNLREPNSQMEFDLDLAIKQDSQNPVYYVQYAHARICSIIRNLSSENINFRECSNQELSLLNTSEEHELIKYLASYTDEIILAAKDYNPSKITKYVINLATLFHKFYNTCHVKGENKDLMYARLYLCVAVKTVIFNILNMFKIDAPESM